MSTKKRIRKNRYKKQALKKRQKNRKQLLPNLGLYLKIVAGVCFIGAMSLSLIFFHDLLTQCDYFKADDIRITGAQRLHQKSILETAGIKKGEIEILSTLLNEGIISQEEYRNSIKTMFNL